MSLRDVVEKPRHYGHQDNARFVYRRTSNTELLASRYRPLARLESLLLSAPESFPERVHVEFKFLAVLSRPCDTGVFTGLDATARHSREALESAHDLL